MRPLNALEQHALDVLRAVNGSLSLKQIGQRCGLASVHDLKVALDTLTLRDLVERIDTGREVTFSALVAQAAAAAGTVISAPPAAALPPVAPKLHPAPTPVADSPASATASNGERVLSYLRNAPASGCTGREIFEALNLAQPAFSVAVRKLEAQGQVIRIGSRANAPLYSLSPSAEAALKTTAEACITAAAPPESNPGLASPAVQPIDTATSTAVPAARETHMAVTEPAGPRDGLSIFENVGAFEPAADELLAWHAQRAEHEAARRRQAAGEPAAVVFGDLNELMPPAFVLPDAMRNSGCDGGAPPVDAVTCVLIDTASYALWSDGRLEIDAGSDHVTLSQPATRALLDYLDRVCAIEQH